MTGQPTPEPVDNEAETQRLLEQQLADLSMVDGTALDVLFRLGQAVFPDASKLGDRSLLIWPENDRRQPTRRGVHEDPRELAARVERTETRFKSLISQIPAVVFFAALGEGENEVFVSPQIEELLGFTAEEWLGDPLLWYRQLHPDDHDRLVAAFTKGVQTGEPFRAEVRFFARDGHEVWILGEARLIKDDLGRPDFFQGVAFDITATKQAQERVTAIERLRVEELTRINAELTAARDAAEEAAAARSIFLATMTHELRTPLNSVIVLSGLLAESALSDEQTEMVRTMQTSAKFLLKLIADILDFSRLRTATLELDMRPVDLRAWLTRTVEIAAPAITDKGLFIDVDVDEHTPEVILADEGRLQQILLNLLTNAAKFTQEGGVEVFLSANALDDHFEFICSVDDSGEGIPLGGSDLLFDEFRQGDAGVARRHGGAGLGLAICKQLCALMGGNIWIEESSLGGARFVFTWQATVADASTLPATPVLHALPNHSVPSRLRILVAEDNAVNTFVLRRVLETLGYSAEFVTDGFEAVSAVEDQEFDVVLMDISMPRMDGLAASRKIRELGDAVRQPVIVGLTAHAMPGDRNAGIEAGMDDYLTKPIDKAELARALAEAARDRTA